MRMMAEQDDDVAEALAYLQDMQNSNHRVAKIQWGRWKKKVVEYAVNKAFGALKKYINSYPFVRCAGNSKRLFNKNNVKNPTTD